MQIYPSIHPKDVFSEFFETVNYFKFPAKIFNFDCFVSNTKLDRSKLSPPRAIKFMNIVKTMLSSKRRL